MTDPKYASDYDRGLAGEARRLCLTVATILGDLLDDIVVVGGLVPYLIVDQEQAAEPHVGTRDLDLGLAVAVLDGGRYEEISESLRREGFKAMVKDDGGIRRPTWVLPGMLISIDFLIPPVDDSAKPGKLQNLEGDFAAIITAGLELAFADAIVLELAGPTLDGEVVTRTVRVCGPAAFVALKANAVELRKKLKDAYDLVYVLMNYGGDDGLAEIAARYGRLLTSAEAEAALRRLAANFATVDHAGPVRAARFRTGEADEVLQADAFGYVQEFLRLVRKTSGRGEDL